jgi:hypothetical protein
MARNILADAMKDKFKGDEVGLQQYVNSMVFMKSELRVETLLNATSTNFKFAMLVNESNNVAGVGTFNTERRLDLQDNFLCNQYQIFIGFPSSNTDINWKPVLNPQSFLVPAADQASMTGLFNAGSLSVLCDNYLISPYLGLLNHMYQGITQQTAAIGAGSPADEYRGSQDGSIASEPYFVFNGARKYTVQVQLPINLASVTSAFTRIGIIFKGLLAQNSTVIN